MDFAFTDAELAFAAEARAWLGANLPPAWRRDHCWTRADDAAWLDVARDWQRMLFEGGWAAIAWPRAHGGRGATVIERWLFDQELDAVGAPRPAAASSVDLIGPAILHHGTAAQRDRFLRPLLSGSELWCQGFSEPGAGSDLASLRTRAERGGGTFVVNGQKVWTSHADIADWCFLLCRTEPDAAKHAGLSLLLVDMRSPGITVRPLRQMNGEAEFSEVFFDGVEVAEDRLVCAAGAGWQIAMGILAHERGPVWTFTFQRRIRRSLGELIRSARDRGALRDPVVRQRLAQAHIEVELLRLVGYRSLTRLLRTGRPGAESSVEKVLGSETDQRLQELAMDVAGPYGLVPGEFGQAWLYSRSETIMGGTSEIQRNVIATRILGLPR